jgi:hypothetical protein
MREIYRIPISSRRNLSGKCYRIPTSFCNLLRIFYRIPTLFRNLWGKFTGSPTSFRNLSGKCYRIPISFCNILRIFYRIPTSFRNLWGKFYRIPTLFRSLRGKCSPTFFDSADRLSVSGSYIHNTVNYSTVQQDYRDCMGEELRWKPRQRFKSHKFAMYNITHNDRKRRRQTIWNVSESARREYTFLCKP